MISPLQVNLSSGTGFLVIELAGEMDLATVEPVRDRLVRIAESVPGVVIVDLAKVEFLDSTALGMFVRMHRAVTDRGGLLVLVNVLPAVGRPISLTGLDRIITVNWAEEPVRPWDSPAGVREVLAEFHVPDPGAHARQRRGATLSS